MSDRRVYLDVCVLCRPFDDQQQARIRLETEALDLILAHVRRAEGIELIVSPAHTVEINAIRNAEERHYLLLLLDQLGVSSQFTPSAVRQRAESFVSAGIGVADAAHVAFAESVQADFVSVDDRLLKQCQRLQLQIWSGSPLAYCDKENLR